MSLRTLAFLAAGTVAALAAAPSMAATDVDFWHAFSPDIKLGKVLTRYADEFNASQDDYRIVLTYKGTYDDTVNATIAATRAGKQPAIVQIHAPAAPTLIFSNAVIEIIAISLHGIAIKGSPFEVNVLPPRPSAPKCVLRCAPADPS